MKDQKYMWSGLAVNHVFAKVGYGTGIRPVFSAHCSCQSETRYTHAGICQLPYSAA